MTWRWRRQSSEAVASGSAIPAGALDTQLSSRGGYLAHGVAHGLRAAAFLARAAARHRGGNGATFLVAATCRAVRPRSGDAGSAGWPGARWRLRFSLRCAGIGRSVLWAPCLPVVAAFYLAATIGSAVNHYLGRGVAWKGRAYQGARRMSGDRGSRDVVRQGPRRRELSRRLAADPSRSARACACVLCASRATPMTLPIPRYAAGGGKDRAARRDGGRAARSARRRLAECARDCARSLAETGVTPRHSLDLLIAFRRDATKLRYANWDELCDYCRYSAMPVGRHVLDLHGEDRGDL